MTSPRPARNHGVTVVKRRTVTSAAFTVILVTDYLVAPQTVAVCRFIIIRELSWHVSFILRSGTRVCRFYIYQFEHELSLLCCIQNRLTWILIRCRCIIILKSNSQNCVVVNKILLFVVKHENKLHRKASQMKVTGLNKIQNLSCTKLISVQYTFEENYKYNFSFVCKEAIKLFENKAMNSLDRNDNAEIHVMRKFKT
jgi:hypothetical protein